MPPHHEKHRRSVDDYGNGHVNGEPRQSQPRQSHFQHLSPLEKHLVAATGEFVGTFFFLFFGYAGHLMVLDQGAATPGATKVIYISLAYSFSLLVTVWTFYRISGGLFNPAVTLGLCLSGQLPWARAAFFIPTQLIACMCAGGVVKVMFPGDIAAVNTTLAPEVNLAQGVFAEMFFTSYLVFVILMLAAEKFEGTYLAPLGIGLALFVAEIPARSFGCAVAAPSFPGYHWIYWVGPLLGALIAAGYYRFVKICHYEEANPEQNNATTTPPEV
ncbi:aquaporin-like protein [Daldinia caldariorum]|uniref:aquaporin-like protein n=1 Tax=Daldinia caldariorum TaxID=326644 RepID=UPI002007FF8C|nr:aquaporin-like protein [Daldinia caldariorum]KAI1468683.1 aquaporin-like protein [Daldinia caldariorum]